MPTRTVAPRLPSITDKGLSFCRRSIRRMTGPLPASWDYRISLGNSQRPTLQRDEPGFLLRYVIGPPARLILRKQYADLGVMEDAVRDSALDWTIVRPALLNDRPPTGTYRTAVGQKPRGVFRISRADLAGYMLQIIRRPDTFGQAITIAQ